MRKFLLVGTFSLLTFSATAQSISGPGVSIPVPISQGGTGATTAATARTNLGLGTMATQNANAVAITGGAITGTTFNNGVIGGVTPLAITGTAGTFNTSITTPFVASPSGSLLFKPAGTTQATLDTAGRFSIGGTAVASQTFFVSNTNGAFWLDVETSGSDAHWIMDPTTGNGWRTTVASNNMSFSNNDLGITALQLTAAAGNAVTITAGTNPTISTTGGSLNFGTQILVAAMTQTSAAQSGTVCYNSGTGAITYDATLGCLASLPELKDIADFISPEEALAGIMKMKPIWASFKQGFDGAAKKNGNQDVAPMFNARELEGIDKRLVGYGTDGKLRGVRYAESIAYLTAAIQAQQAQISALSSR